MDPMECLQRILDAVAANDRDDYSSACQDLAAWLRAGGFAPTVPFGTPYIPGTGTSWSLSPRDLDGAYTLARWTHLGTTAESYILPGAAPVEG